jgi:TrbL/VirB6 plasmid conjugal transfer protein
VRHRPPATALAAAALAAATLAFASPAGGGYQGSDVFANVAPPSQIERTSGLMHRHSGANYALDTHVDVGLTNPGALFSLIPHLLASQLWDLTKLLVLAVISLFIWAFSLDLLNGSGGGGGALAPIADAIETLYTHSFGRAWLVVGILLAGLWGIWKALLQRRYLETTGQLALSVAFVIVALFFVQQPEQTIGRASEWTNQLSLAFLSGATRGSVTSPDAAKREVADHLFRTLVHEPWVVLNFGGPQHCVDSDHRPVAPDDPRRTRCIDHLASSAGRGGYATRFLRYRPGSEARNAEYEALRDGKLPTSSRVDALADVFGGLTRGDLADAFAGAADLVDPIDPNQFDGYTVDADDRPAVDIQQQGGGFQRLTMAVLIFAGTLGAVLLLGALSLAVVLAQILVLFFLAFAPLALVAGVFPGRGHDLFRGWLSRLVGALLRKALYSLVLAVVLAVSTALLAATASLGWLLTFGLQAAFYWTVFLYRNDILARFALATGAGAPPHGRADLPRSFRTMRTRLLRATGPHARHANTQRAAHLTHGDPAGARPPAGFGPRSRTPDSEARGGSRAHLRPITEIGTDTRRDVTAVPPATDHRRRQQPERRTAATPPDRTKNPTTTPAPDHARSSGAAAANRPPTGPGPSDRAKAATRSDEEHTLREELERDRRRLDERARNRSTDARSPRPVIRFPWRRP